MQELRVLPIALMLLVSAATCHDAGETSVIVDTDGWKMVQIEDVTFSWLVMEDSFRFTVTAPTTGWVAAGFGGGPAMKDAAIVIGYAEGGEQYVRDDHGTSPVTHVPDIDLDGSGDLTDAQVHESDGETQLSFVMPMESEDDLDPSLSPGETIRVIVAYGNNDSFTGRHTAAHSAEIEL